MYVYLIFLAVFFLVPGVVLFFALRKEIFRYKRTILWCFVFVFTVGLIWDWLSVKTGVWRYDSARTLGIWIDGLPVEEFIGFYILGTFLIIAVLLLVKKVTKNV
ncbi:lycopene cyclase domain-containing protein [candidate division KSB1 bacterium]